MINHTHTSYSPPKKRSHINIGNPRDIRAVPDANKPNHRKKK
uniref:Uncharacterized protein n=1 Tax=Arundo donax TaxID=35708 RepID=A0A0A9GXD5_ARUDO